MSWAVGWDSDWRRWIGYGVPAYCDHPKCAEEIDRGLAYRCGGQNLDTSKGCHGFFCEKHRNWESLCPRCVAYKPAYKRQKPEHPIWIRHLLTDESWSAWRKENPAEVGKLLALQSTEKPVSLSRESESSAQDSQKALFPRVGGEGFEAAT